MGKRELCRWYGNLSQIIITDNRAGKVICPIARMRVFMNKFLLLLIAAMCRGEASAQDPSTVHYVGNLTESPLSVPTIDIRDSEVLDTTFLRATYRFHYRVDPTRNQANTWIHLDVGNRYVKSSIDDYFRRDSLYTYRFKSLVSSCSVGRIPCEEVLYRFSDRTAIVFNRETDGPAALWVYEECFPEIDWKISEKAAVSIFGYPCHQATGSFGGRTWTVWFTSRVPVAFGPWKLYGLPGLVVLAEEAESCYRFELIRVRAVRRPIVWYQCLYKRTTREKWRAYEKGLHEHPTDFVGDDVWYMYRGQRLDDSWSIPYNPIERE
mgnify:FL=1